MALLLVAAAACTDSSREGGREGVEIKDLPAALRPLFPAPEVDTSPSKGWFEESCSLPADQLQLIRRGFWAGRSPDLIFVPRIPNYIGEFDYTTHGGPWDYLQKVPLILYGPGFIRPTGARPPDDPATVADIAPTTAELLGTPWPDGRPGRVLDEALVPAARRPIPPRLIATIVLDGGGTDVLDAWPRAWPRLADMVEGGAHMEGAIAGSSPSVTPPVHATIGTGAWPRTHGIVDLTQRNKAGDVRDSFGNKLRNFTPENLELSTVADLFDAATGNEALVGMIGFRGWHLGMMGHGAFLPGGDRDLAAIVEDGETGLVEQDDHYQLPGYMHDVPGFEKDSREVDAKDGRIDDKWMGHVSLKDELLVQYTPVWTRYQTRLAESLLDRQGFGKDEIPDLFFANYKQIDDVGHFYNMLSPEMEEILQETDAALGRLARFFDREIGKGRWVMIVTADHGETPHARTTAAWPIPLAQLQKAIADHFDVELDDLFEQERTMGFWFYPDVLRDEGISVQEIADFIVDYRLEDSVPSDEEIPPDYRDRAREKVFAAAFPTTQLDRVWRCSQGITG